MNRYRYERELQMPQGEVLPYRLDHDPGLRQDYDLSSGGELRLRLRAEAEVVLACEVVILLDDVPSTFPLARRFQDRNGELWESAALHHEAGSEYYFVLHTITGKALLGATGLQGNVPKEARFRPPSQLPSHVPSWARGASFYQIFPDRFYRPGAQEVGLEPWDDEPTGSGFKGGTLDGITGKIDYIERLGAKVLWLNPIFSSPSNHRYDTTDFYSVDPLLGNERDLEALVRGAHDRGLRVILDGVFNHVSDKHPFFEDAVAHGRDSAYWNWFQFRRWPVLERSELYYSAWWGHPHLPQLNLRNQEVREYLIEVGTHWIREYDIDGWRLDVAGEVPRDFWTAFRQAVRGIKSDALLLGEVWGDGRAFLQGDVFDATMNYPFRRAVIMFLSGELSAVEFCSYLNRLYYRFARDIAESQYNLLGSHDVSRIRDVLGKDERLVEMAFAIQCAYPGATALYYGDELGLCGEGDPGCRKAFPRQQPVDDRLRVRLEDFLTLRRDTQVLRTGDLRCYALDEESLVIERSRDGTCLSLKLNRGRKTYSWDTGD